MIPLNYHHLYYFWTVGRLGSISAAGHELYLSQSTLSTQLKELEEAFKAKLLVRSRSGVSLTPEGRSVFERCERIFAEGAELVSLVRSGYTAPAVMKVGLRPTVTREVPLRVLRFAHAKDASSRVAVFSGEAEALVDKLKRQALDLIIANRDLSVSSRDLRGRLVAQLPVFFVASRAVRKLVKRFPADLVKTPLLLRPTDTPVRKQVDQFLARRRLVCPIEADSDDVELLRGLAIEGRGVTALSGLELAADLKAGRLTTLHPSPIGLHEPVWFIVRVQPHGNPAVRRLIDGVMEEFSL